MSDDPFFIRVQGNTTSVNQFDIRQVSLVSLLQVKIGFVIGQFAGLLSLSSLAKVCHPPYVGNRIGPESSK